MILIELRNHIATVEVGMTVVGATECFFMVEVRMTYYHLYYLYCFLPACSGEGQGGVYLLIPQTNIQFRF